MTRAGVGTFFFGDVDVAASAASVTENGGSLVYTISRTGTDGDLMVPLVLSGTAAEGVNFKSMPHGVTIPDGESSATLPVTPVVALDTASTTLSVAASGDGLFFVGDAATATIADWVEPAPSSFGYSIAYKASGCVISQAEALSHFPALLRIAPEYVATIGSASGLAFFQDGALLPHEVEAWSAQEGGLVWVGMDALYTNAAVTCAWGKDGYAAPDLSCDLWREAGYVAVWHLSEGADGVVDLADASINGVAASSAASTTAFASGAVGGGRTISNGSGSGWIDADTPNAYLGDQATFTVSFWQNALPLTTTSWMGASQSRENEDPGWTLRRTAVAADYSTETVKAYGRLAESGGSDSLTFTFNGPVTNSWAHYSLVADSGRLVVLERNGDARSFSTAYLPTSDPMVFGSLGDHSGSGFPGSVDEIRIRDAASSTTWLAAEHAVVADGEFMARDLVMPVFGEISMMATNETTAIFAMQIPTIGSQGGLPASSSVLKAYVLVAGASDPWDASQATEQTLASLSSATNTSFTVTGLSPNTGYQVVFEITSIICGVAYTTATEPMAFTTIEVDYNPAVVVEASAVYASAADLVTTVTRFGYGATAVSPLLLSYGTNALDESTWTTIALVPPAAEGGFVGTRLLGLQGGVTFYARAFVTNNLPTSYGASSSVLSFTTVATGLSVADVTSTGESVTTTTIADGSTVVHFLADGTFTIQDDSDARLLLVGGGGGGGAECGGGGGAGGFVEIASTTLEAGTYSISVGARGEGGNTPANGNVKQGGNGGPTVLSFGGSAMYTAAGGGGGGVWNGVAGSAGGSGGGGGNLNGAGGAGTDGQGFAGGANGGGGGGAGGPGGVGAGSKNTGVNGAGGIGRMSDITGEEVWYAGGGGGGGYDDNPGAGGAGGGGNGMRSGNEATRKARSQAEFDAEAGVDGLGGGGGGGNNTSAYYGRPGGSGTLIVRFSNCDNYDESQPRAMIDAILPGIESITVTGTVQRTGFGSDSVKVSYRVATTRAGLDSAADVAVFPSVAAGDTVAFTVGGLTEASEYHVCIVVENTLGVATRSTDRFCVPYGPAFAPFVTEGAASEKEYLGDTVWTFVTNATFTLARPQFVRYLAVGGGGGGGRSNQAGGGGGAGGMIEGEGLFLEAGTYVVNVGAGGAASTANGSRGANGGDTWLGKVGNGFTNVVLNAIGGGGGGSYDGNFITGSSGGSGGGAGTQNNNLNYAGGAGTAGQGNGGGNTSPDTLAMAGGGGGAGEAGATGTATASGAGGAGRASDITGETTYYAGGGGGGGRNESVQSVRMGGAGGIGGGGHGRRSYSAYGDEAGVDGLGGGGGGSCGGSVGGRGGSGVLILRGPRTSADAPDASVSAEPTPDGAAVTARLEYTGVADAADLYLSYTLRGSGVTNAIATAAGAEAGDTISRTLSGLTLGATYDFIATASNDGGETAAIASVTVPAETMSVTDTAGAAEVRRVGTDLVAIYTNPASAGTFTVANAGFAEVLLVGGGGGGGRQFGGGGGAGGFVHIDSVYLAPGTYSIEVGEGGAGAVHANSDTVYAGDGGDSVLSLAGNGGELFRAFGGGGGASNGYRTGRNGGSGGGSIQEGTSNWNIGGHGVPGQGHDGSAGGVYIYRNGYSSYEMPGGGGGAGEPGHDFDQDAFIGAAGGDGLPCSITGEEVWYAGGGGGGSQYVRLFDTPNGENFIVHGGDGGRGGGGRGHRNSDTWFGDEDGVDGLGGGGGGGARDKGNNATSTRNGSRGGNGTVIIRWKATASSDPAATISGVDGAVKGATVTGKVENGSNVSIEMATATSGSALGAYTAIGSGLNAGDSFTLVLNGLADETAYDYVVRVAGGAASGAVTGTFTTLAAAAETSIAVASNASDPTAVDVTITLASSGDLSVAYGLAPDSLTLSKSVATGATPGTYAATISGLGAGETWYFAPVVGTTKGDVVAFAVPPAVASPAGDGYGLWQTTTIPYNTAAMRVAITNAALWEVVTMSNSVSGVLAANCPVDNYRFQDPVTKQWFIWNSPKASMRLYAYRGYMYMEGGKTYTFGSRFAQFLRLAIDGSEIINFSGSMTDARGTFTPSATGWYSIDVRVGRNSDTFGVDGDGVRSWTSFGLAFNTIGADASMPESNWTPLMDDGSGSLLRPFKPDFRTVTLGDWSVADGSLTITASVGAGESEATAYVVYGETMGVGGLEVGGLEVPGCTVVSLGSVAASAAATEVSATVAGWGTDALVARIALVTDGAIAWTEPVAYAATALPSLESVFGEAPNGDALVVSGVVSSGTAPYNAQILIGADAESLAVAKQARLNAAGSFTVTATELTPGTTIFWRLAVTDANGAKVVTDILQVALPGASRLYQRYISGTQTPLDGSDYVSANPVVANQRTLTLGGTLSVLGAGDTYVGLLYGKWFPSEPEVPSYQTPFHDGDLFQVTSAGAFSATRTFDWDETIRYNWMVTNSNGIVSWSTWRPANESRTIVIADAQTYTWKGGARGDWQDANAWQNEGIWEDNAGFPRRGSGAFFESFTTSVVEVADLADNHGSDSRFSQLVLGEGTDVTFTSKAGSAKRLILTGEDNTIPSREFALKMGQDSTLTFSNALAYLSYSYIPRWMNGTENKYLTETGVSLRIVDCPNFTLGSNDGGDAWRSESKADTSILFKNSVAKVNGRLYISGARSSAVIDDARVTQSYRNNDASYIQLCGSSMNGAPTLTIKGAHPVLKAGSRVLTDGGDSNQYIDFVVPEAGWREAPIQTHQSNATTGRTFGQGTTGSRRIVLRIPTNAPAAVAGATLDVPLVNWTAAIDPTYVTLDSANLPHPATDYFYTTTEAGTGNTILWARLVGQTESADPQASDFRQTAVSAAGATVTFTAIPGSGASGATIAATILDASGENAVAGASATVSPSSIDAAGVVTVTITGLEAGTQYTLSVTLTDTGDDSNSATATFQFWTVGDYGAGSTSDATSTAADGPFTVWTFNDTATAGQTFNVTKPGYAEVLIVGGGGSGGGGAWGNYGGGGGGGGQVRSETVFLLPGAYSVRVGAGGARRTDRAGNGNAGSLSFFDEYAAVGGGYGACNAVGGNGASGGGGSNNKAGGAATAGFAGGFGYSDGGGAGGGGAGGAGSDSAKYAGGAGGAGVTSLITGQPAIYGAGGGGGGTRENSVAGAAGADTAGSGAANSSAWYDSDRIATMNASDGFGGGGGGGCGSYDNNHNAYGAAWGGKGGNGTVIVRMRTSTALVPEPQFELRSVAPRMDGADLEIDLFSIGTGGDSADILMAWDETASYDSAVGFSATNNYATWSAAQRTVVNAIWLKPSTEYTAKVIVTNGAASAESAVFTFTTLDEERGFLTQIGGGFWSYTNNLPSSAKVDTSREVNYGVTAVFTVGSKQYGSGPEVLTDGYLADGAGDCGPGAGRTLVWTLPSAKSIDSIIFSGHHSAGYSPAGVSSIEVCEYGVWRTLPGTDYAGLATSDARQVYTYAVTQPGEVLAAHATAVRVSFKNNANNNYSIYREIAMMGGEGFPIARPVSVASTALTEDTLYATLSIDVGAEAAAITAFWGDVYQGTDTNAWANALALGSAPANESVFIGSVPASVSASRYLRFRAVTESGGVSWTQVVYPREMEEVDEIEPQVALVEVTDITVGSVNVTASLLHAGSGAAGGRADVTIEYSTDSEVFESGSATVTNSQALATSATAGTLAPVTVTGLRPERIYTARLKVVNAGGQVAYCDVFTFATAAAGSGDASGGTSSPGLWQTFFTSANGDWTKDIWEVPEGEDWLNYTDANRIRRPELTPIGAYLGGNPGANKYVSELWGDHVYWPVNGGQWVYAGYIWLDATKTYKFRMYIDDNERIQITDSDTGETTTLLEDKGSAKAINTSASYTPSVTGWHAIEIRMSDGNGGVGGYDSSNNYRNSNNLGWSDDDGATWSMLADPGDGSILRTLPKRNVSVTQYEATVSGVDFTISLGSSSVSGALLAAYGATDGGADTNAWDNLVAIGTVAAVGGTVDYSWTGVAASTPFFRFFTADGAIIGDSGTVFVDAVNPYVVVDDIAENGDRVTVNATVVAEGASAVTVAIQWNDGEAFDATAAQSQTVTGWTLGVGFSEVIEVTPFTNVWVRLVAQNAAGGYDATAPVCLATRGPAQFGSAVNPSVNHRTVTYNGSLVRLGAGTTELILYTGPSADALAPVATNVATAAGAFSFVETYTADPQVLYYAFLAHSESAGGSVFETWTATNNVETKDDVTYTWKANVAEGDWNDPANWTPSAHAGDCTGYPNHSSSVASFANCTLATAVTVRVNGNYTTGTLKFFGSAASDVTFAGTGPFESGITAGQSGKSLQSNSTVEFRDLSLVRTGDWEIMRDMGARTNITIRFSNVVTTAGTYSYFSFCTPDSRFEFLNGSVATGASKFNVGGSNTVVVVDNSTVSMPAEFHFNADCGRAGPVTLLIRGKNAKVASASTFYIYSHSKGHGVNVVFELPEGGFAEPPIQLTSSANAFGNSGSADGTAKFSFEISPDSPALTMSRARLTGEVMVQTVAGINTAKVVDGIGTVPPHRYRPGSDPVGAFRYDTVSSPKKILLGVKGWGPPPTFLIMR